MSAQSLGELSCYRKAAHKQYVTSLLNLAFFTVAFIWSTILSALWCAESMKKVYNLLQALHVCCLHLSCWFDSLFVLPLCSVDGVHRILVATSEAMLYIASIDPRE